MTTTHTPAAAMPTEARSRVVAYRVLRGLLVFFGVFGAAAATVFGFLTDPADGGIANGFDLFVTLWKIGLSLAMLVAALAPGLDRSRRVVVALWAMGAELVFDAIKIGHYHESAALVFLAVDCALLALVLVVRHGSTSRRAG